MEAVASPLTGDDPVLRPVKLTAAQATELRLRVSRDGRNPPISQYERELYATEGLEPPVSDGDEPGD
ncbi:hypothetical protein ACJH6J_29110 [Mycobacterium sp. SMC-18]|uniref:hypothetical protein n=1 Tax=Mycobacterium TaxID=1763 RepID=UPI000CDE15E0|nr:hypothetical protein [Mycobacterium kansasii]POX75466.1 hypothetical protein C3475_03180 [Mycobacterium kansasii]POY13666.1 hypothetical protein C3474_02500 [Mycobacterium kansasii]